MDDFLGPLRVLRRRFVPIVLGLLLVALLIGWIAREASHPRVQAGPTASRTYEKRAVTSSTGSTAKSTLETVAYADLPSGARATLRLTDKGGPYPYRQDNSVYQNRNGALPVRSRGYYHEFTVATPGAGDRGPRRIVLGADRTAYYTANHYETFRRVLR